jgi:drug/metabolite transporter (DMT)-like permease
MADGSEMLTYLLYAVLVIVLAVAGWYIGNRWNYKEVGAVVGGLIGVGIVYWHSTSGNSYSSF